MMWRCFVASCLVIAIPRTALAEDTGHEISWHTGFHYMAAPDRLVAGIGGGPGYRFHLSERFSVTGQVEVLVLAGNTVAAGAGVDYALRTGFWRPSLGVHTWFLFGGAVLIIDSNDPDPPVVPAISVELLVSPFTFRNQRYSARFLSAGLRRGLDSGLRGSGFALELFAAGIRF